MKIYNKLSTSLILNRASSYAIEQSTSSTFKLMLNAGKKIAKHIDSCLSCYSCMTTCPSGVNYMHLIDHGRNHVEETYKRPFLDRMFRNILSYVLPRPKVFFTMSILTKFIKPFSFILPKFLKNSLELMESLKITYFPTYFNKVLSSILFNI